VEVLLCGFGPGARDGGARDAMGRIDDALATSQLAHLSGFHVAVERGAAESAFAHRPGGFGAGRRSVPDRSLRARRRGRRRCATRSFQSLHDHRVVLIHQDSFYRGLTPEEQSQVHDYNFDHPGRPAPEGKTSS